MVLELYSMLTANSDILGHVVPPSSGYMSNFFLFHLTRLAVKITIILRASYE
jgi:hypothetical protein